MNIFPTSGSRAQLEGAEHNSFEGWVGKLVGRSLKIDPF